MVVPEVGDKKMRPVSSQAVQTGLAGRGAYRLAAGPAGSAAWVTRELTFCPQCGRRITNPAEHMTASAPCRAGRPTRTRNSAPRPLLWADSQRW